MVVFIGGLPPRTLGSAITGGTNIGNMTSNGGLAAAFDGNTNQNAGASAERLAATTAYVGKTPASAKRVFKFDAYGANNFGYQGNNDSTTLTLYGKTGSAPASATDGTAIGSVTFTDTSTANMQSVTSTDNETLWDHIWMTISHGSAVGNWCAELILYEAV
jgi:hypothetical protein